MNSTQHSDSFTAESILEAFLAGTNDAYLVLNKTCNVVSYNKGYEFFHQNFLTENIKQGLNYLSLIKISQFNLLYNNINSIIEHKQVIKFTTKAVEVKTHNTHWFDFEIHPLKDIHGEMTGIGIGIFDITEKNTIAEQIKKSEELFKALVLNSTDAFQLTDAELKISYVSDSVKSIIGYEKEELLNNHFFNFIHPDDKLVISTWLHWLMHHQGIVRSVEVRIRNKKGDWIYIEINGNNMIGVDKIDAIVMNYRDIQAKKIAEKALSLAEQRMGLLLNNTKESFIIVNSRLRVITYNRAAQEHSPFFFTQELQSGISLLDLIREPDIEEIINTFESVFDGNETERETSFIDSENVLHVYNHSFRPLFSEEDIVGVFITSTNITEKKKAELQLKTSEERNRTIIQESFDAMLIKDYSNTIIEASPAVEKLLGYKPEELLGIKCFDFIHEDYIDKTVELVNYITEKPEREASLDVLIRNKKGEYIWVEIKGKNMYHNKLINGMIVMLRDISVRKQAEEVVLLSEQRFRGLVQSGADMISIIDEEGYVKYSSPTVTKILGNIPTEDIDKNVFQFIHPDDSQATKEVFEQMLVNGTRQMYFGLYRFPNAKKQYRWLETVVTNLSDDPAIKGIVINSRDVTETKRLNEEQQALTEELIKNNQDLQQFSFITSHNLRAPVANLISLLNLFDKENVDEPFNKVLIEKFEEATQQLNVTLNDLLEVLVLKSNSDISIEPLSLITIFDLVKRNVENLLKEQNGTIVTDFSKVNVVIYNRLHLESIFLNIISNAIKYRSPERSPVIEITSYYEDKWIVIAFKDNGIGIDLIRYKDRIFGMYQRFHAGKEGKGLGLYMIKAQVMAMGGKIEVESELHQSTTFKVYLKNNGKV